MKTIELNGVSYPVNYGMNALAEYSDMRDISMNDTLNLNIKKLKLKDYMTLLFVGLKDGARKAGEDCKFKNVEEFLDFADENTEIVGLIAEVFANYGKERKEEPGKKK